MKKAAILFILSTAVFNFTFSADKNNSSPYKGSCSTFLMENGSDLMAGHNLDDRYQVSGAVVINKRNVFKKGITWKELSTSVMETSPKLNRYRNGARLVLIREVNNWVRLTIYLFNNASFSDLFFLSTTTIPKNPSTVKVSPVSTRLATSGTPVTQGIAYSRAIMAP